MNAKRVISASVAAMMIICCPFFAGAASGKNTIEVGLVEMRSTLTVRVGQTRIIPVLISPTNADDKSLSWTSSDEEVAVIIDDGIVAGVSPGTAEIKAESVNGRKAYCTVTVPANPISGIELDTELIDLPVYESSGELLSAYELRVAVEKAAGGAKKGETAIVSYNNKSSLSSAALRSAAYAAEAEGATVSLRFNTIDAKGSVQGRISFDPILAKNTQKDIKLAVYTSTGKTGDVKARIEEAYKNRIAVIRCAEQGEYGMLVEIAAKPDLSRLNPSKLRFYTYNSSDNACRPLENASYWIDSNGYLRLSADKGGIIIVTDSELLKK